MNHRQFNRGEYLKVKPTAEKVIVRNLKKKPNSSSLQLKDALAKKGVDLFDRCVRNIRKDLDHEKIKTSLLLNLNLDNIQSQCDYCKKYLNDKFSNVVFSDESHFQLVTNRQVLWYRKEEDKPFLTKPRNNKKIMIWGGLPKRPNSFMHLSA